MSNICLIYVYKGQGYFYLVAYYMEGRSREQCMARFETLNPSANKKGKWSDAEDMVRETNGSIVV